MRCFRNPVPNLVEAAPNGAPFLRPGKRPGLRNGCAFGAPPESGSRPIVDANNSRPSCLILALHRFGPAKPCPKTQAPRIFVAHFVETSRSSGEPTKCATKCATKVALIRKVSCKEDAPVAAAILAAVWSLDIFEEVLILHLISHLVQFWYFQPIPAPRQPPGPRVPDRVAPLPPTSLPPFGSIEWNPGCVGAEDCCAAGRLRRCSTPHSRKRAAVDRQRRGVYPRGSKAAPGSPRSPTLDHKP